MRHFTRLTLLSLVLVTVLAGAAVADDIKPFGVIDSARIFEEYEAARDVKQQMEKFYRDMENEVKDRQRELLRMQDDYLSQQMLLGEAARAQREQELEQAKNEYLRFQQQVEERIQQEQSTKLGEIIQQVTTIAERIGKEEGFGIIVDMAAFSVLYVDDQVDLTNRVLEALARGEEE